MSEINIACIVEGDGEVQAVPILLQRIVRELAPSVRLNVPPPPIRVHRQKIVKADELEKAVQLAANKANLPRAILILLDADKECPAALAPALLQRARAARSDIPIAVVFAQPEFETWFIAAAESIGGHQGLSETLTCPSSPESIRGAKEWLRQNMQPNRRYSETVDQPELTRRFDMSAARQLASFDKLWREVARLLQEAGALP